MELSWMIPIAYFCFSAFISCIALNISQPFRLSFLLPILLPAIKSFATINYLNGIAPGLAQLCGHTVLVHIVHITSVLYLEKWKLDPEPSNWDLHAAYKIWGNPQLLNTRREVPYSRNKLSPELSRIRFLVHRGLHLGVLYLIHKYVVTPAFPSAFMPLSIDSFAPAQEKYFRRLLASQVTVYESLLRAVLAVHWIWANVFGLHLAQTGVAILFLVILRWDEPWEWPLLFGSPLEAYSLRRFWGRFWHRIVAPPYTTYGLCILRSCGITPDSPVEKIFTVIFVFLLSGIAHSLVTWQTIGCGYWRDISWFLANAVAAIGETLMTKWWTREKGKKSTDRACRLYQVFGAIWVFAFLFWSVPKWEYGKIYCVAQRMQT